MPRFEIVSLNQAMMEIATGRRRELVKEYLPYIERLGEGQAGKLQPAEGEMISTVKRRLIDASKFASKNLVVKHAGEQLYFRVQVEQQQPKRKRGRPRKAQQE